MVDTILQISGAIMVVSLILTLYRFFKGNTVVDRVISFDVMTIISISLIALITYFSGREIYLDVALVYGLLSFLGVIIVAKYLEKSL
jgi:multicomponent Na+:H+ antiporter subunit F